LKIFRRNPSTFALPNRKRSAKNGSFARFAAARRQLPEHRQGIRAERENDIGGDHKNKLVARKQLAARGLPNDYDHDWLAWIFSW